jgi:NTP pyrophosphatase (non-canonical NTP hydrolase)
LKLDVLRERDRQLQARWDQDRTSAAKDLEFMRQWYEVMSAMSRLRHQNPLIVHVERLLSDAA